MPEKDMATHSTVLAWRIPGTEEPGGLPSMGSHRVGHDWSDLAAAAARETPLLVAYFLKIKIIKAMECSVEGSLGEQASFIGIGAQEEVSCVSILNQAWASCRLRVRTCIFPRREGWAEALVLEVGLGLLWKSVVSGLSSHSGSIPAGSHCSELLPGL